MKLRYAILGSIACVMLANATIVAQDDITTLGGPPFEGKTPVMQGLDRVVQEKMKNREYLAQKVSEVASQQKQQLVNNLHSLQERINASMRDLISFVQQHGNTVTQPQYTANLLRNFEALQKDAQAFIKTLQDNLISKYR